jgi:hypothetical protein
MWLALGRLSERSPQVVLPETEAPALKSLSALGNEYVVQCDLRFLPSHQLSCGFRHLHVVLPGQRRICEGGVPVGVAGRPGGARPPSSLSPNIRQPDRA